MTIREVAEQIATSLRGEDPERGEAEARRLAFSFVEAFDRSKIADRQLIVAERPEGTGDAGFDALLAAVVSTSVLRLRLPLQPGWTNPVASWRRGGLSPAFGRCMPTPWSIALSRLPVAGYLSRATHSPTPDRAARSRWCPSCLPCAGRRAWAHWYASGCVRCRWRCDGGCLRGSSGDGRCGCCVRADERGSFGCSTGCRAARP